MVSRDSSCQCLFSFATPALVPAAEGLALEEELSSFRQFGTDTLRTETHWGGAAGESRAVPTCVNEFWTARQRQAHSLHDISYRACFKPQLPRFFVERLTSPGQVVYDPFMGRGTTPLEAALLGRVPCGCDINPLSVMLTRPRLQPPLLGEIQARLRQIDFADHDEFPGDLLEFYHRSTLEQICALKKYLLRSAADGRADAVDDWIRLVAINRLTGHSKGFFSVYTLPPNQAVSVKSQRRINERRRQTPPPRSVPELILKKSRQLLGDVDSITRHQLAAVASRSQWLTRLADDTPEIPDGAVDLVVTSPPFLDVVDYATDNWLRCWFVGIDARSVPITIRRTLVEWQKAMTQVFAELCRVLRPAGHIAFEVGEVHRGRTRLEEAVVPAGVAAGLEPRLIVINQQQFTKTANCWGVDNNAKGTNTNRIVLFRKPG